MFFVPCFSCVPLLLGKDLQLVGHVNHYDVYITIFKHSNILLGHMADKHLRILLGYLPVQVGVREIVTSIRAFSLVKWLTNICAFSLVIWLAKCWSERLSPIWVHSPWSYGWQTVGQRDCCQHASILLGHMDDQVFVTELVANMQAFSLVIWLAKCWSHSLSPTCKHSLWSYGWPSVGHRACCQHASILLGHMDGQVLVTELVTNMQVFSLVIWLAKCRS